ncbi:ferrochelatase [Hahella chejuensis]|uniref:ferrochelatase n=1 Tax=Hahella chejuensis TaxID=158327 RepID=UPI0002F4689A|nr:ferrochelatase [Hahella chejuensis]
MIISPDNTRSAVLLVNLGTPDAPDAPSIRRYLKQFLSDPRVIEAPRLIWWAVLNLVILRFRPRKLIPNYRKIWTPKGSPIKTITQQQACGLQNALGQELGARVLVDFAMTYGAPSLPDKLAALQRQGIEKVLVLPLYPQYSATTTAASFDALAQAMAKMRDIPELRFVKRYHNHPAYIASLVDSVRAHWRVRGRQGKLLFSFHGLPKAYVEKGDPYRRDAEETALAVARELKLDESQWLMSFQSRVGTAEWLKPYTDATVTELGANGCEALDVICPGFSADCLETLEEIEEENRGLYEQAGGKDFHYIPALNAEPEHIELLQELCEQHLRGWI